MIAVMIAVMITVMISGMITTEYIIFAFSIEH